MYRVYVIELSSKAASKLAGEIKPPRIPWVYVGSSWHAPEKRFEIHRAGGLRASSVVRDFGRCLRPDLYEDLAPTDSRELGVQLESERARELAATGFTAHTDGKTYRPATEPEEWDYDRLASVMRHLDEAILAVVQRAARSPDREHCVRMLRGETDRETLSYIADPIPVFGRFAHVRREALLRRIEELRAAGVVREVSGEALVAAETESLARE